MEVERNIVSILVLYILCLRYLLDMELEMFKWGPGSMSLNLKREDRAGNLNLGIRL